MKVECQLMFCRSISDTIYHFNGSLIVTIQKVYFEAFDTHFGVLLAGGFQLFVEYIEYCPKNDINSFLFSVGNQFRKVQFRNDSQHITAFLVIPTLVEHYKLYIIPAGEVYVIFIGIHIDTCLKGDTFQIPVIPPIPGYFSGLYP